MHEIPDALDFVFARQINIQEVGPGPEANIFIPMDPDDDGSEGSIPKNNIMIDHIVIIVASNCASPVIS